MKPGLSDELRRALKPGLLPRATRAVRTAPGIAGMDQVDSSLYAFTDEIFYEDQDLQPNL